jgi:hypothetical protein
MEAGSGAEMQVMQEGAIRTAGTRDKADRDAGKSRLTFGCILTKNGEASD